MESLIVVALVLWLFSSLFDKKSKQQAAQKRRMAAPPVTVVPETQETDAPAPASVQTSLFTPQEGGMVAEDMTPERMVPETAVPRTGVYQGSMGAQSTHEGEDPCHPGDTPYVAELRKRLEEKHKATEETRMDHRLTVMEGAVELDDILPVEQHGSFRLNLEPENLQQAIIMSEVLTRPCQRRRKAC